MYQGVRRGLKKWIPQSTVSSWKCLQVVNLVIGPDNCVYYGHPGPILAKHMLLDYSHSSSLQLISPSALRQQNS